MGETISCEAPLITDCTSWSFYILRLQSFLALGYGIGPILLHSKVAFPTSHVLLASLFGSGLIVYHVASTLSNVAIPGVYLVLGGACSVIYLSAWSLAFDSITSDMFPHMISCLQLGWITGEIFVRVMTEETSAQIYFDEFSILSYDFVQHTPTAITMIPPTASIHGETLSNVSLCILVTIAVSFTVLWLKPIRALGANIRSGRNLVALENAIILHKKRFCPVFFAEKLVLHLNAMNEAERDRHFYLRPSRLYPCIIALILNLIAYFGGSFTDVVSSSNADNRMLLLCSFLCVAVVSQLIGFVSQSRILIFGALTSFIARLVSLVAISRETNQYASFFLTIDRSIWKATWESICFAWTLQVLPAILHSPVYGLIIGTTWVIGGLSQMALIGNDTISNSWIVNIIALIASGLGVIFAMTGLFIEPAPAQPGHTYYRDTDNRGLWATIFRCPEKLHLSTAHVMIFSEIREYAVVLADRPLPDFVRTPPTHAELIEEEEDDLILSTCSSYDHLPCPIKNRRNFWYRRHSQHSEESNREHRSLRGTKIKLRKMTAKTLRSTKKWHRRRDNVNSNEVGNLNMEALEGTQNPPQHLIIKYSDASNGDSCTSSTPPGLEDSSSMNDRAAKYKLEKRNETHAQKSYFERPSINLAYRNDKRKKHPRYIARVAEPDELEGMQRYNLTKLVMNDIKVRDKNLLSRTAHHCIDDSDDKFPVRPASMSGV